MVGFLANTVPVRTAVDDTMPLQVFFDGVVERRRQALQHQDIPFGALQNLQRGSDPLIEVLCIHQNVPYAGFSLPGVQCEVESVQVGETKFPLNLQTLHDGENWLFTLSMPARTSPKVRSCACWQRCSGF